MALLCACGRIGFDQVTVPPETFRVELDTTESRVRAVALLDDGAIAISGRVAAPGTHLVDAVAGTSLQVAPFPYVGGNDVFVAVLELDGRVRWAKAFGSVNDDEVECLSVGPNGDLFLGGALGGVADLGGGPVLPAGSDGFLLELTPDGDYVTQMLFSGPNSEDDVTAIHFDPAGDAVVVGVVSGPVDFGGGITPSSGSISDGFVATYSPDRSLRWVNRYGGVGRTVVSGLAIDAGGDIYIAGSYEAAYDFGGGTVPYRGGTDAMLLGLDASGGFRWNQTWGGTGNELATSIALIGSTVVVGAHYETTIDLPVPPASGSKDGLVATFSTTGTSGWTRSFGSPGCDRVVGVATSATEIFAVGQFSGPITLDDRTISPEAGTDGLMLRFAMSGAVVEIRTEADPGDSSMFEITPDAHVVVGRRDALESGDCLSQTNGIGFVERW